jgi:4,5-dihydroxyphthalate decarboxylase
VFPTRHFRHSAIYVNRSSGISRPQDLVGKTIGEFATYGHDGGIWPKGILADEYGVTPAQSRWVIGGTDWWMPPFGFIPFVHPDDVDVELTPEGKQLGPMLEAGEIDALISAVVPGCVMAGSPQVAQLFPDYETVEREYYRELLGDDWWPYGMEANRKAIDTLMRYSFEQGPSKRRLVCEDIFAEQLLDT